MWKKITLKEDDKLFEVQELNSVLKLSKNNKAPGPNGLKIKKSLKA